MPTFVGMTKGLSYKGVNPEDAHKTWIPAFARMTLKTLQTIFARASTKNACLTSLNVICRALLAEAATPRLMDRCLTPE